MSKQKQQKQRYPLHAVMHARTAGQKAFVIGTDPANNPYSGDARKAWDKGFFDEMNARDYVRPAHGLKPQPRLRYPAHARLPFGERLPDKPFRRVWQRERNDQTSVERVQSFKA